MACALLSVKKLTGAGIVKAAARHNLREIQAELGADGGIDPSRSHLNVILHGPASAAEVVALADRLMNEAGAIRLRKDAVRAIEMLVALPPGVVSDEAGFFCAAVEWARHFFMGVPVLSAVVHRDEGAPHLHVVLLPLINGRMVGSDMVGGKRRLYEMQAGFYGAVAKRYGLSRPGDQRMNGIEKERVARQILLCLEDDPTRLRDPHVRQALKDAIKLNIEPLMAAFGINVPTTTGKPKRERSFAEVWAKPVKPEPATNPIGF